MTSRYVLFYLLYVVAIHAIDGPWRQWTKGRVIDPWTLTHVIWGVIARKMHVPFTTYMFLAVLNEVGEALARTYAPHLTWGTPESGWNVTMDLVANAIGYKLPLE